MYPALINQIANLEYKRFRGIPAHIYRHLAVTYAHRRVE